MIYLCSTCSHYAQGQPLETSITQWSALGPLYPPSMWLGGAIDRAAWYRHKFKEGQVIEASIRDDGGKAQGTVLLRVLHHEETLATGHVFQAEYISASDSHYRWWMCEGAGKPFKTKAVYHSCEGNCHDCSYTRGRVRLIHLEQFRVIGSKEWAAKVPDWAFKGPPKKDVELFHEKVKSGKTEASNVISLPWVELDEDSGADTGSSEVESDPDTIGRIKALKAELKQLEERGQKKKKSKAKDGNLGTKKKRHGHDDGGKRDHSPSSEAKKEKIKKKKKKGKKVNEEKHRVKRAERRAVEGSESSQQKKRKPKKAKEKQRSSSSPESRDSESAEEDDNLFRGGESAKREARKYPRKGDRGPFGSGVPVTFKGESSSDSEKSPFREAPVQPQKSGQMALMGYSLRHPGRLAARLLLKMKSEVALGSTGANMESDDKTPAVGVQYLLQILTPHLGARMNVRTQRELRTLMVILDLLARNQPARAADVVSQRVKALERATSEGNWSSAQFLELIPTEAASMLERDEEVYLSKEALLEQRLKGGERPSWKAQKGDPKGGKGKGRGQKGSEGKGKKETEK